MTLLFCNQAMEQIPLLEKKYRNEVKEAAGNKFGLTFPKYLPWMGLYRLEPSEIIQSLCTSNSEKFIVTDGRLLENISILKLLSNEKYEELKRVPVMRSVAPQHSERLITSYKKLISRSKYFSTISKSMVDFIVPLDLVKNFEAGMSCHYTRGAVFLGIRSDELPTLKMAISIAHEIGHHVLMLYQHCDSIIVDGQKNKTVYSPIREVHRPAIQTFHAVVALAFIAKAIIDFSTFRNLDNAERNYLAITYDQYRSKALESLVDLKHNCLFTPIGNLLCEEIETLFNGGSKLAV